MWYIRFGTGDWAGCELSDVDTECLMCHEWSKPEVSFPQACGTHSCRKVVSAGGVSPIVSAAAAEWAAPRSSWKDKGQPHFCMQIFYGFINWCKTVFYHRRREGFLFIFIFYKGFIFIDIDCERWQSNGEGMILWKDFMVSQANRCWLERVLSTEHRMHQDHTLQPLSQHQPSICPSFVWLAGEAADQTGKQAQMESEHSCGSRPPLFGSTYWFTLWEFSRFGLQPTATHAGLSEPRMNEVTRVKLLDLF